jgi:hypothetical protein
MEKEPVAVFKLMASAKGCKIHQAHEARAELPPSRYAIP